MICPSHWCKPDNVLCRLHSDRNYLHGYLDIIRAQPDTKKVLIKLSTTLKTRARVAKEIKASENAQDTTENSMHCLSLPERFKLADRLNTSFPPGNEKFLLRYTHSNTLIRKKKCHGNLSWRHRNMTALCRLKMNYWNILCKKQVSRYRYTNKENERRTLRNIWDTQLTQKLS